MRVAICCELSTPSDLVHDALTLGKALMARGHEALFIAGDVVSLVDHGGGWLPTELHQAPVLRPAPHLVMKRPNPDGLADHMAAMGFDDKRALVALATVWDRQLAALRPDVIVGFHTPMAWLVGPDQAPTFALGNGLALPPLADRSYPRLSPQSTPLADDDFLLENANAALSRLGRPSLAALSEILARCEAIQYGLPAFDPYLQLRRTVSAGLLGDRATGPAAPPVEARLLVTLDVYCPGVEMIALAVAGFDRTPADVHIASAPASMRRFLEHQPHVRLWSDQAALLEDAAAATVLVHHGEQNVAQRALVLGRPQLMIPWTPEQILLQQCTGWMGCVWEKKPTVSIDEMAGTFRSILKDHSLSVAAQHHARQLASADLPDALPGIVARIEARGPAQRSPA